MNVHGKRLGLVITLMGLGLAPNADAALKWQFDYTTLNPIINNPCNGSLVSGEIKCGSFNGNQASPAIDTVPVDGVGPKVSVTGWADSGLAGDVGNRLRQGQVHSYSGGLGVRWLGNNPDRAVTTDDENSGSPEHSMDNCGNTTNCSANPAPEDFILLAFDAPVVLSQVAVGWAQTDSDITVLAYMPGGVVANPGNAPDMTNKTYSATDGAGGSTLGLINDGWKWVGHYANLHNTCTSSNPSNCSASTPGTKTVNTGVAIANEQAVSGLPGGKFASSFWLVGAYNSRVNSTNPGWTADNDFMKLVSVKGDAFVPPGPPQGAPEPATAMLASLGLLVGMRRWRKGGNKA